MKVTYSLYDGEDLIAEKKTSDYISKKTGISIRKISSQATNGYRYKKRYLIIPDGEIDDVPKWRTDFIKGWGEVREAVEVLKNHGKIIKQKGKWITVAE